MNGMQRVLYMIRHEHTGKPGGIIPPAFSDRGKAADNPVFSRRTSEPHGSATAHVHRHSGRSSPDETVQQEPDTIGFPGILRSLKNHHHFLICPAIRPFFLGDQLKYICHTVLLSAKRLCAARRICRLSRKRSVGQRYAAFVSDDPNGTLCLFLCDLAF